MQKWDVVDEYLQDFTRLFNAVSELYYISIATLKISTVHNQSPNLI